jgi:hypothetical protein
MFSLKNDQDSTEVFVDAFSVRFNITNHLKLFISDLNQKTSVSFSHKIGKGELKINMSGSNNLPAITQNIDI